MQQRERERMLEGYMQRRGRDGRKKSKKAAQIGGEARKKRGKVNSRGMFATRDAA